MSVDSVTSIAGERPAAGEASAAGVASAAGTPGVIGRLRALIRAGGASDGARLRRLLEQAVDPLDMEAAGGLLRGTRAQHQLRAADDLLTSPIALLGSSTLDAVPALLTTAALRRGLRPEITAGGFNQWYAQIMTGAPDLVDARPRIVACLLDDTAVFAEVSDLVEVEQVVARCAAFPAVLAQWATACREALGALVVLTTVPLSPLRRRSVISYAGRARIEAAWLRMNAGIMDLAAAQPAIVTLSDADLSAAAGATFATTRMRHVAGHAYAPHYLAAYAEELARVAAADLGRSSKCLVLDLDDTLWGGVVGDVGTAGLQLAGGYPGSAYRAVQSLARDLSRQGVLLALASKNDEPAAAAALAEHPDMLLRADSFAAGRIDWQPKPDNVRSIASQLNIGLEALVFVDDNPVERDLMRRLAPQVVTVELTEAPDGFADRIAERGDFMVLSLTDEDRSRAARYRAQAQRAAPPQVLTAPAVGTADGLAEHLMGLDSRLRIERLTPLNHARIVQLFAKTNQFNLTGVRYGAEDVRYRAETGRTAFFGARLSDRYGDEGLIAALAVDSAPDGAWRIENFVLSCRVFSRSVEDAIVGLLLRDAAGRGAPAVTAAFRATERNAKFRGFYPALGFVSVGPRETAGSVDAVGSDDDPADLADAEAAVTYRHDLSRLPGLPRWISIANDREVFHAT
jgi:FkbH-like protein